MRLRTREAITKSNIGLNRHLKANQNILSFKREKLLALKRYFILA
nr:MAG TPA: hypothetical protein [Caudoviricetes sp.]